MTKPHHRATLGLFFALLWGCGDVQVLGDLAESEANAVVAALAASGIRSTKSPTGARWTVQVDTGQEAQAFLVVEHAGFPRTPPSPEPTRLVVGPTEARLRAERQKAADLERLLRGLPGVQQARVVLSKLGCSAVVRTSENGPENAETIQGLLRANLPAEAQLSVTFHPSLAPSIAALPPADARVPLLSTAVALLVIACLYLLVHIRRLRRRLG